MDSVRDQEAEEVQVGTAGRRLGRGEERAERVDEG